MYVAADFPTAAALQLAIFNEEYLSLNQQIEAWNPLRRADYAISYKDTVSVTHTFAPADGTSFPQ